MNGSYETTLATLISTRRPDRVRSGAHDGGAPHVAGGGAGEERARALVPTVGLVEALRVRKDEYEIATLREAARRLSGVAVRVMADVQRGRTEREVAMTIDLRIREAGFSAPAFETIVASGPNAALPHARPGERILSEGDLVVLDFGGVYDSYCVDLTRTVSIGVASGRAREVYGAVRDAHDRAIAAVAPGRSPFEIDQAARDTLGGQGARRRVRSRDGPRAGHRGARGTPDRAAAAGAGHAGRHAAGRHGLHD